MHRGVRAEAAAIGKFLGRSRYEGPHRSHALRSSSEMGLDKNFSRADITFIFCISFMLSLPSLDLPPSLKSKSMSSHRPRKSLKPVCRSGYRPRMSHTRP